MKNSNNADIRNIALPNKLDFIIKPPKNNKKSSKLYKHGNSFTLESMFNEVKF
jgi:hypothetical protein